MLLYNIWQQLSHQNTLNILLLLGFFSLICHLFIGKTCSCLPQPRISCVWAQVVSFPLHYTCTCPLHSTEKRGPEGVATLVKGIVWKSRISCSVLMFMEIQTFIVDLLVLQIRYVCMRRRTWFHMQIHWKVSSSLKIQLFFAKKCFLFFFFSCQSLLRAVTGGVGPTPPSQLK